MKQAIKRFALTAMGLFVAFAAIAQVTTSSMSGRITETNGTPIPGATVLAVHMPSGSQFYAITDNTGNYRIQNMRVGGPYNVAIQTLGFRKLETQGITISLADNYVLNAVLQEEAVGLDEIVVSAVSTTSNMRSDRAGAITSINLEAINGTPTIDRSMNDLIKMTPQVFVSGSGPQIGGGSYRQSFVTVDGAAFNNAFGIGQNLPASGSPISLDALEQISISVTPYDVRQSGFTGGSINAVTRSGSNEFSGSIYTYFNNQDFQGNKVGSTTLTKNDSKYFVYGARVGGPIIKNKLFFFLNFEKESITEPGPSRVAATPAKPYTNGSDNVARPTASTMDLLSNYLNSTYGYNPGAYQGYSSQSPGMKFLARLDWNINKNHKFNIRYSNTEKKSPSSPSTSTSGLGNRNFTTDSRTSMKAMYFQNARYYQETNFSSIAGELTSRFLEGRLSNALRVSYSHQYEPRSTEGGEFPFVDIAVAGNVYTSFGTELFSYGNLRDVKTTNITDEISYSLGKHNFMAGIQYEHNNTKNGFQRFGAGYYQYAFANEDALVAAINGGTLFNNPAQYAITHSYNEDFSQAYPEFNFNQLSFYLQDEYSISDKFKVLAGVRFELPMYPALNTYSEQVANTQLGEHNNNGGYYDTSVLPSTKLMFSPRVGFNWDITGDRAFVLRGGTGLFTGRIPFVWIVAQSGDSGVLQNTYTAVSGGSATVPTFMPNRVDQLNQIYPNGITASTATITQVSLMAEDLRMPQTWKTSLALDARLPGGILATLEGIYNKDVNPVTVCNAGLQDPVNTAIPNYADNRPYYGKYYNSTLKNAYLLKNADEAGYYYSLTAKLEKNNWHGLSGMLAYTYSKAESLNDGFGDQLYSAFQSAYTVNGNNRQELAAPSYVMPHRLIGSLSYRKEYGKHFATGISLFYEGGPQGRLSYTYTSNVLGDGGAYNLIYVPASADELSFSNYTYKDGTGATQTYTATQQAADFWNFVNNDDYLKTRKGKYAERNGAVYPWSHQFDVKLTQDFFVNVKGKRNTIQLGLDIQNLGNLLNKDWGHRYYYNQYAILKQASNKFAQGSTNEPVYQFQRNGVDVLTKTFRPDNSFSSTYSMQISLRYIFN
ncbi:MAG: carboxypeptidase regulatory-like domain-containing protein [Bacteroidales bacterium]|nr:carboxypeptidase regulatory-like domain-containing protein [Bacteroidales bacterium]